MKIHYHLHSIPAKNYRTWIYLWQAQVKRHSTKQLTTKMSTASITWKTNWQPGSRLKETQDVIPDPGTDHGLKGSRGLGTDSSKRHNWWNFNLHSTLDKIILSILNFWNTESSEIHWLVTSGMCPDQGSNPQPRYVFWPGIEPTTVLVYRMMFHTTEPPYNIFLTNQQTKENCFAGPSS